MEVHIDGIQTMTVEDQMGITAGDYVESSLGLLYGLAAGAGVVAGASAAPLLLMGVFAGGGALLLWSSL